MIDHVFNCHLRGLMVAGLVWAGTGLAAEDRVEVTNVRFNTLRPPDGGTDNWFEMDIELEARPASTSPGRATERVLVVAMLAYDRPGPDNVRRWEFFRASAELVALTAGRAHVRFYLPPEIVRRDSLAGAPQYWEVTVTGESLTGDAPITRTSAALSTAAVRQGFHDKMAGEGPANDGVMQPQYLTPFATGYPRATPTFVRREAWR